MVVQIKDMIDLNHAKSIAKSYVVEMCKSTSLDLELIEFPTHLGDYGWVFTYHCNEYLRTGLDKYQIGGNAPIIISKKDGSIHVTGTAHPVEYYVENYIKFGNPHAVASGSVQLMEYGLVTEPVSVIRAIQKNCDVTIHEAKATYENLIAGQTPTLQLDNKAAATEFVSTLKEFGVKAIQLGEVPKQA